MKKLLPILTLPLTAAAVATPLVLTSCSKWGKTNITLSVTGDVKISDILVSTPTFSGNDNLFFQFTLAAGNTLDPNTTEFNFNGQTCYLYQLLNKENFIINDVNKDANQRLEFFMAPYQYRPYFIEGKENTCVVNLKTVATSRISQQCTLTQNSRAQTQSPDDVTWYLETQCHSGSSKFSIPLKETAIKDPTRYFITAYNVAAANYTINIMNDNLTITVNYTAFQSLKFAWQNQAWKDGLMSFTLDFHPIGE